MIQATVVAEQSEGVPLQVARGFRSTIERLVGGWHPTLESPFALAFGYMTAGTQAGAVPNNKEGAQVEDPGRWARYASDAARVPLDTHGSRTSDGYAIAVVVDHIVESTP